MKPQPPSTKHRQLLCCGREPSFSLTTNCHSLLISFPSHALTSCCLSSVCHLLSLYLSHSLISFFINYQLIHKDTTHHLHSHTIAWGSGSGQQSVTTTGSQNDANSLWLIKESTKYLDGKKSHSGCELGIPVQCGDKIRLEHVGTGKLLHSHLYKAAVSGNQEVSGFGNKGAGDTGDNWIVQCESGETIWRRGSIFNLVHVDTSRFLTSSGKHKFTAQNCGQGCPIMGQNEVSAADKQTSGANWMTGQGVYFPPKDAKKANNDEL